MEQRDQLGGAVVLEAVAQNASALEHAPAALRNERDFVLYAVARNPDALQHASEELQGDRESLVVCGSVPGYAGDAVLFEI